MALKGRLNLMKKLDTSKFTNARVQVQASSFNVPSREFLHFSSVHSGLRLSVLAAAVGMTLGSPWALASIESNQSDLIRILPAPVTAQANSAGGPDSDGDGIRNQDDQDDDNDGILDRDEGGVDNDGDGFHDNNSVDTDGDGTPDVLDLDSDNDGILDNMEARLSRSTVMSLDQVPNGAIDIAFSVGNNGIADVIETSPDSGQLVESLPDTDGDGTPDFRDLDSDNDGIFDVVEAGSPDNDTDGRLDGFFDADGKGVSDTVQTPVCHCSIRMATVRSTFEILTPMPIPFQIVLKAVAMPAFLQTLMETVQLIIANQTVMETV